MTTFTQTVRKSAIATSACLALLATSVSASAADYPLYLEDELLAVCHAIHTDDTRALKKAVRKSGLSLKVLNKGLRCNGDDMVTFAERHEAMETSDLLARRLRLTEGTLTARR